MQSSLPHVLVVEDDREISDLLSRYLVENDFRVSVASDGRAMSRHLAEARPDLVILDLMLPGEDGLSLCRTIRASSDIPIVMVTAKGEDIDRILGLEMGADDYVTKPFNPRELLARIKAILRRTTRARDEEPEHYRLFTFVEWQLDLSVHQLTSPQNARVPLTSAEFDLLRVFCEKAGRVLSREQILEQTQGRAPGPFERSIDVLVSRLRHKIEPDPREPTLIRTIRSGGYLFTPEVVRT